MVWRPAPTPFEESLGLARRTRRESEELRLRASRLRDRAQDLGRERRRLVAQALEAPWRERAGEGGDRAGSVLP